MNGDRSVLPFFKDSRSKFFALPFFLLLSSCSILFNPDNVQPLGCPTSAAACPAVPNTTASCQDDACAYSCVSTFVDGNADLASRETDGCEISCSEGTTPENPATLSARVGARPGEVEWTFPTSPTATRYRFCTALLGSPEMCRELAATACNAGLCQLTTTGHPDNARVSGKAIALDVCGREGSMATAATVSATPLDLTSPAGWMLEKSCGASTSSVLGGQLAIENPSGFCTSSLVGGDELWGDFTIDATLRFSGTPTDAILAGFAFHQNATGHRMSALAGPASSNNGELSFLSQRKNGSEKFVATSIAGASATGLTHLRLVSKAGVISFSHGPDEARLVEVLRWSDAVSRTGRIGMGLANSGRAELTDFRVTTSASISATSARSLFLDFADGGFPAGTRARPSTLVRIEPCPALPSSPRCDGGCLPAAGANCAHVEHPFLSTSNLSIDLPPGLDVRAPWSLSLRFAVPDGGNASFPNVVNSPQGALLLANNWNAPVRGMGLNDYGVVMEAGQWHGAAWSFNPDAGRFDLTLDDQPVPLTNAVFPPAGWSHHLGVLTVGEGFVNDVYVTDFRISQP